MVVLVVVSVNHGVLTVGYQVVIYGFDYLDHGITAAAAFICVVAFLQQQQQQHFTCDS